MEVLVDSEINKKKFLRSSMAQKRVRPSEIIKKNPTFLFLSFQCFKSANDVAPFFEDIPKAADIVRTQEIDGHALIFFERRRF